MNGTSAGKVFLSYGRADATMLADQLAQDLGGHMLAGREHYTAWKDRVEITAGGSWAEQLAAALENVDAVVAVMTPQSVRSRADGSASSDSVCLDEISFARFHAGKPIVPVMGVLCTPPFEIFRLDYVDFTGWQQPTVYQQALGKLLDSIAAALRGEVRYRFWADRLQPWDFGDFLERKRAGFVGREWLLAKIDSWLRKPAQPALLIVGGPGLGKSAIVAEYLHRNPDGRILAYHCCQSTVHETLSASRFVRSVAGMVASRHPAYEALLDRAPYRDVLTEKSCNRDPESAFEEGVLAALKRVGPPASGQWILLVDALDEAMQAPGQGVPGIVDLLARRIDRFPVWLSVVATSRPEKPVLDALASLNPLVVDAADPQNLADLRRYVETRLAAPALTDKIAAGGKTAVWAADALTQVAAGNFLVAEQTLAALERNLLAVDELTEVPPGLAQQYRFFFDRRFSSANAWDEVKQLLAVLVAAQDAIGIDEMAAATRLDPKIELPKRLAALVSYVSRTPGKPPRYAPFHKSLVEWLADEAEQGGHYAIDPVLGHQLLADGLLARYEADRFALGPYALAHLPYHLSEAIAGAQPAQRVARQRALAEFLLDPAVQSQRVDDPFGMDASLRLGLQRALLGDPRMATPVALRLALGWEAFRRQRLDASRIFALAREGELAKAERELQLYNADDNWLDAARLVAAWMAEDKQPAAADALRRKHRTGTALDERVDAAFEKRLPQFAALPQTDQHLVEEALQRAGGSDHEVNQSMLWDQAAPPPSGEPIDAEGTRYLAEFDAPLIVALVQSEPVTGNQRLQEYIALNVANAYRVYRNGSLWQILRAVARHRNPEWVRDTAGPIVAAALSGGGREFGGATPIALAALRAALDPARLVQFDALQACALKQIGKLAAVRGRGDSWGDYCRTLGALAETRTLVFHEDARKLAEDAIGIPPGYAGFQTSASLALAESLAICGADRGVIDAALKAALTAAHNVQDLVFCARSVSRVHGLTRNWWRGPKRDAVALTGTIDRLARLPRAAEFTAVHEVGEPYAERRAVNPTSRLPAWFLGARTLRDLARVYQWPLADFESVNPEIGSPDTALPDGMLVRVPDPRWQSMLAAYVAGAVLRAPDMKAGEKARFILQLLPVSTGSRTSLDAVSARMLLALGGTQTADFDYIEEGLKAYPAPEGAPGP